MNRLTLIDEANRVVKDAFERGIRKTAQPSEIIEIDEFGTVHAPTFRSELELLLNRRCMESASDTPDFILAEYLAGCLDLFDATVRQREAWLGDRARE